MPLRPSSSPGGPRRRGSLAARVAELEAALAAQERVAAELRQSHALALASAEEARAAAEHAAERVTLLSVAGAILASSPDYRVTLARVADLLVPRLGDCCLVEIAGLGGAPSRLLIRDAHPGRSVEAPPPGELAGQWAAHPFAGALEAPGALIVAEPTPAQRALLAAPDVVSCLCLPLRRRGEAVGLVVVGTTDARRVYASHDRALADELAQRVGEAIERAELASAWREATARKDDAFALLDTIFATAPIGLGVLDADLRYIRVNQALAEVDGLDAAAYVGRTPAELLPALAPTFEPILRRVLTTGVAARDIEIYGETAAAPGEPRAWLASYFPVRGADGAVGGVGVLVAEITERVRSQQALRERDAQLRLAYDAAELGSWRRHLAPDTRTLLLDARARLHYGSADERLHLDDLIARVHPDDRPMLERLTEAMADPKAPSRAFIEYRVRHPDGSLHWLAVHVNAFFLGEGSARRPVLVTGAVQDVTARKEAEEQVRAALAAEQVARRIVELASERASRLQAITADLAGALTREAVLEVMTGHGKAATGAQAAVVALVDAAGEQLEMAGRSMGDAVDLAAYRPVPLSDYSPQALAARLGEPVWLTSREDAEDRFPGVGKAMASVGDGASAALPLVVAGRVLGVVSFTYREANPFSPADRDFLANLAQQCAQALERAQLYGEVLAAHARLRTVSERLIAVQEEERHHLARELHDEIGQSLTGLSLMLTMGPELPTAELHAQLAEAQHQVSGLIAQVRRRSLDLRPSMLDDMGLRPALAWYLARYTEQSGIALDAQLQGLEARFAPLVELTAYRIVQEALTNVARHAGVGRASVAVWVVNGELLIEVADAGRGFDVEAARSAYVSSGLAGMRERAALLGGDLTIEAAPGAGTRLLANLPAARRAGPEEDAP